MVAFGLHVLCKKPEVFMIPRIFQKLNSFLKYLLGGIVRATAEAQFRDTTITNIAYHLPDLIIRYFLNAFALRDGRDQTIYMHNMYLI